VTVYAAKFLSSAEAEALSRSEGEAIALVAQQRDCFVAALLAMTHNIGVNLRPIPNHRGTESTVTGSHTLWMRMGGV
jgi:hypothetical protein